jgi:hypothetical protein
MQQDDGWVRWIPGFAVEDFEIRNVGCLEGNDRDSHFGILRLNTIRPGAHATHGLKAGRKLAILPNHHDAIVLANPANELHDVVSIAITYKRGICASP